MPRVSGSRGGAHIKYGRWRILVFDPHSLEARSGHLRLQRGTDERRRDGRHAPDRDELNPIAPPLPPGDTALVCAQAEQLGYRRSAGRA